MALPIHLTKADAKAMGIEIGLSSSCLVHSPAQRKPSSKTNLASFNRFSNELASKAENAIIHRYTPLLLKIYKQSPGQAILSLACLLEFDKDVHLEFLPLQGRRIRLDIAFVDLKVAVEVNGWSNHGKTLDAFKLDHQRTRDLMLAGWVIVPFTATDAKMDTTSCLMFIRSFLVNKGAALQ
jgi:hypothetical protein